MYSIKVLKAANNYLDMRFDIVLEDHEYDPKYHVFICEDESDLVFVTFSVVDEFEDAPSREFYEEIASNYIPDIDPDHCSMLIRFDDLQMKVYENRGFLRHAVNVISTL